MNSQPPNRPITDEDKLLPPKKRKLSPSVEALIFFTPSVLTFLIWSYMIYSYEFALLPLAYATPIALGLISAGCLAGLNKSHHVVLSWSFVGRFVLSTFTQAIMIAISLFIWFILTLHYYYGLSF